MRLDGACCGGGLFHPGRGPSHSDALQRFHHTRLRPLCLTVDKGRYELGTKDHVLKPMEFGLQCWQRHEHELVRGLLPRVCN